MTSTTTELDGQLEQMVAALRKAGQGAVERAFAAAIAAHQRWYGGASPLAGKVAGMRRSEDGYGGCRV